MKRSTASVILSLNVLSIAYTALPAGAGFSDAPARALQTNCFLTDQFIYGESLTGYSGVSVDPAGCQKLCQDNAIKGCMYFAYNKVNKKCDLKIETLGDPAYLPGFVSGPVTCNGYVQPVTPVKGTQYPVANIPAAGSITSTPANVNDAGIWKYNSKPVNTATETYHFDTQYQLGLNEFGWGTWWGSAPGVVDGFTSWEYCRAACEATTAPITCNYFLYVFDPATPTKGGCYFFVGRAPMGPLLPAASNKKLQSIAGQARATATSTLVANCVDAGLAYYDASTPGLKAPVYQAQQKVVDVVTCKAACDSASPCVAYQYNSQSQECILLSGYIGKYAVSPYIFSGKKAVACPNTLGTTNPVQPATAAAPALSNTCYTVGVDVTNPALTGQTSVYGSVPTVDICSQICTANAGCVAFSYAPSWKGCYLKGATGSTSGKPVDVTYTNRLLVSGAKGCTALPSAIAPPTPQLVNTTCSVSQAQADVISVCEHAKANVAYVLDLTFPIASQQIYNVNSPLECLVACRNLAGCLYWVYSQSLATCTALPTYTSTQAAALSKDVTSGQAYCIDDTAVSSVFDVLLSSSTTSTTTSVPLVTVPSTGTQYPPPIAMPLPSTTPPKHPGGCRSCLWTYNPDFAAAGYQASAFDVNIDYQVGLGPSSWGKWWGDWNGYADWTQCLKACQADAHCNFWVYVFNSRQYNKNKGGCYFKTGKNPTGPAPSGLQLIAGPKNPPGKGRALQQNSCYDHGYNYYYPNLLTPPVVSDVPGVASASACQALCQADAKCVAFEYDDGFSGSATNWKNCKLLAGYSGKLLHNPFKTSGPKQCGATHTFPSIPEPTTTVPSTSCFKSGVAVQGNILVDSIGPSVLSSVPSPDACQRVCALHPGCVAWYIGALDGTCYMKSTVSGTVGVPSTIAGPKSCDTALPAVNSKADLSNSNCPLVKANWDYLIPGQTNGIPVVATADDCAKLCRTIAGCVYWTFNAELHICWPKPDKGRDVPAATYNVLTSGPAYCEDTPGSPVVYNANYQQPPANNCPLQYNVDYTYGTHLPGSGFLKMANWTQCQTLCQSTSGCNYFVYAYKPETYVMRLGDCYLKATNANQTAAVDGYSLIAGPGRCACYTRDSYYFGSQYGNTTLANTVTDCQQSCANVTACVAFTYSSTSQQCLMWSSTVGYQSSSGYMSGPKTCGTPQETPAKPLFPSSCPTPVEPTVLTITPIIPKNSNGDPYDMWTYNPTPSSAGCDETLFDYNVDYQWEKQSTGWGKWWGSDRNYPTWLHCKAACVADPDCLAWVYVFNTTSYAKSGGGCYPKTGQLQVGPAPLGLQLVSGPKSANCTGDKPASVTNFNYGFTLYATGLLEPTVITSATNVTDAASCQALCQRYVNCVAFEYNAGPACYPQSKECFLYAAYYGLALSTPWKVVGPKSTTEATLIDTKWPRFLPAQTNPIAPAHNNTCFKVGVDVVGSPLLAPSPIYSYITTPEACQAICQKTPGCDAFTYGRAWGGCYLKSGVLKTVVDTATISGLADCSKTLPAPTGSVKIPLCPSPVLNGSVRQLYDLKATGTGTSRGERETTCEQDAAKAYSYLIEPNVDYTGELIQDSKGQSNWGKIETPLDCLYLCRRTFGCMYWTHDNTLKTCWLKKNKHSAQRSGYYRVLTSGPAYQSAGKVYEPSSSGGAGEDVSKKIPPLSQCRGVQAGIDYHQGVDLPGSGSGIAKDWVVCQDLCRQTCGCVGFVYTYSSSADPTYGGCFLKAQLYPVTAPKVGVISIAGPATCYSFDDAPALCGGVELDVDYQAYDDLPGSSATLGLAGWSECQKLCADSNECKFFVFTYNPGDASIGGCFLKKANVPRGSPVNGIKTVAGPKVCYGGKPEKPVGKPPVGFEEQPPIGPCGGVAYNVDLQTHQDLPGSGYTNFVYWTECQAACKQASGCNYFVFALDGGCYFKAGNTPTGRPTAGPIISGPAVCAFAQQPSTWGCGGIQYDVDYQPGDQNNLPGSGELGLTKWTDCQALCQQTTNCKFFVYSYNYQAGRGGCYMKASNFPQGVPLPDKAIISGPAYCGPANPFFAQPSIAECGGIYYDLDYASGDQYNLPGSGMLHYATWPQCQKLCQQTAECNYFVYAFNPEKYLSEFGACYLKAGTVPTMKPSPYGVKTIAGPKTCAFSTQPPPNGCGGLDYDIIYNPKESLPTNSTIIGKDWSSCQSVCNSTVGCKYFTFSFSYDNTTKTATKPSCALKSMSVPQEPTKCANSTTCDYSKHSISGAAACHYPDAVSGMNPIASCPGVQINVDMAYQRDLPGSGPLGIKDWSGCQDLCRQTAGCIYWVYSFETAKYYDTLGGCYMKGMVGLLTNPLPDHTSIAGPVNCGVHNANATTSTSTAVTSTGTGLVQSKVLTAKLQDVEYNPANPTWVQFMQLVKSTIALTLNIPADDIKWIQFTNGSVVVDWLPAPSYDLERVQTLWEKQLANSTSPINTLFNVCLSCPSNRVVLVPAIELPTTTSSTTSTSKDCALDGSCTTTHKGGSDGLSPGAIAGIAIGATAGAALLVGGGVYLAKRKEESSEEESQENAAGSATPGRLEASASPDNRTM